MKSSGVRDQACNIQRPIGNNERFAEVESGSHVQFAMCGHWPCYAPPLFPLEPTLGRSCGQIRRLE